jgi:hypothetical protein
LFLRKYWGKSTITKAARAVLKETVKKGNFASMWQFLLLSRYTDKMLTISFINDVMYDVVHRKELFM